MNNASQDYLARRRRGEDALTLVSFARGPPACTLGKCMCQMSFL